MNISPAKSSNLVITLNVLVFCSGFCTNKTIFYTLQASNASSIGSSKIKQIMTDDSAIENSQLKDAQNGPLIKSGIYAIQNHSGSASNIQLKAGQNGSLIKSGIHAIENNSGSIENRNRPNLKVRHVIFTSITSIQVK